MKALTYALEDQHFRARIEQLVAEHGIKTIVETGLDKGLSAVELARMVPNYVGIDIDPVCVHATRLMMMRCGVFGPKVTFHIADSGKALVGLQTEGPTFYFLDAHCFGDTDCPIREEIDAIPRGRGVLAFHDIWVPGREHGGFSPLIDGVETRFDYDLIWPALTRWSPEHRIEYLANYATELAPGVMFAFPKDVQ